MHRHSFPPPARLLAATLMAVEIACGGWRTADVAPQRYLDIHRPDVVRVTTVAGDRFLLFAPTLRGDSLVGFDRPGNGREQGPRGVPLSDILEIEGRHGPSPLLIAGGVTLLVVAVAAATSQQPAEFQPKTTGSSTDGLNLGSCPAIDSWDGSDWRIDSGTYSGAITAGLSRAELDNLEYAVPDEGTLRLRIRTEPGETDHIDAVEVLAATHPAGTQAIPDAAGQVHAVGRLAPPIRAVDDRGRDAGPQLARRDAWAWESVPTGRDTARLADVRSWLDLTFVRPEGAQTARLVLDAVTTPWAAYLNHELLALNGTGTADWYQMMDGNPLAAAMFTATRTREAWLGASVRTRDGWQRQGVYSEAGGEVSREQVAVLDLSAVDGDTVFVHLESAPSFWLVDYAAMDFGPELPVGVQPLSPTRAIARDGRDVRSLLSAADRAELVQETGDWTELSYAVPPVPAGEHVSYLVRTTGWYRIHTPQTGAPQTALLRRLAGEPWAISRLSTARLNDALDRMGAGGR
jgi:hypothetical protein